MLVADTGLGSLAVGYLLAARGRTVGVVDRPVRAGTTAVSVVAARRVVPIRELIELAPVVSRRSSLVLQPEGALAAGFASDRLRDPAHAVAIVERDPVAGALVEGIRGLGGLILAAAGSPEIDETGSLIAVPGPDGVTTTARCTILSEVDVGRLFAMLPETPRLLPWSAEAEWAFDLDQGTVAARFSLGEGMAAEWWLYGDPFDGGGGFGRIRAFGGTVTLAVALPLATVLDRRVDVADLGERLRAHPAIAPLLDGASEVGTSGSTVALEVSADACSVGDGWVVGPRALPHDLHPLSSEIEMAELIAESVDAALATPRVTAARLTTLPKRLRQVQTCAPTLPLGPIDAWADELVGNPARLVDGARLLAARFGDAG